ncbi:MAG: hypothetical protein KME10_16405 [Plectolyngbya sp. WJT66-NPBG17]|jgi:hypothetical protein|nr:hypothetical protein [Plectolyngbya sp. WJT66-NPBG17]
MKRSWLIGCFAVAVLLFTTLSSIAQTPSPSPTGALGVPVAPIPVDPSLPSNRPALPTASPSPTASPQASPTATPPVIPIAPVTPSLPAAATAQPLPVSGDYKDPNNRFTVGILQGYKVSPLAGTVLIEAPDGNLAYSVLAQPQSQLGVTGGVIPNEALVTAAQNAFRQGEGFQTGEVRSIPGGVQIDWTGNLTIAGQTQPVGGVILARQANNNVLLALIAATNVGGDRILGAASALSDSLRAS